MKKIKAKTVLKDKFWIVEDKGDKVGTLSVNDDLFVFSNGSETKVFPDIGNFKKHYGVDIVFSDAKIKEESIVSEKEVSGYPTSCNPYNTMYDVRRKLPLFTKSTKSKSLYCAGYYIIEFDKGWVKSFCPKLITIERYNYKGPFTTDIEMRQELSRVNAK
jgi:hypothetical protein